MSEYSIKCKKHGNAKIAFVCYHLTTKEKKQGWWEPTERKSDPKDKFSKCMNAWCGVCEAARREHKGWNKKSGEIARIVAVCEKCALQMKKKNI